MRTIYHKNLTVQDMTIDEAFIASCEEEEYQVGDIYSMDSIVTVVGPEPTMLYGFNSHICGYIIDVVPTAF